MAARDSVIREIELRLGGQMVDVELDPEHYHLSVDKALERFRQRSENAPEESLMVLPLLPDVQEYTLPNEVIEVKDIYRRGGGSGISSSGGIEPFGASFMNQHMLQSSGGGGKCGGKKAGGLATFDFFAQHQELLDRLFVNEIIFTWNHVTKKLTLHRNIRGEQEAILHTWNYRTEEELLNDIYAAPWLKEYALAQSKLMLAEARGKFAQIAGPQGGTTLNADSLRQDALETLATLEDEVRTAVPGDMGYGFIIG